MISPFKIYNKKEKHYITDYTIEIKNDHCVFYDEHDNLIPENDIEKLHYTRIHDINNNPIFEGDRVKVVNNESGYEFEGTVVSDLQYNAPSYDITYPSSHCYECNVFSHELATEGIIYRIHGKYDNLEN